jgi:hypothetical protein
MDQQTLSGINYTQHLDTCVLASYAVACFPFTNKQPVLDYFVAYCRHFNKVENPSPNLDEAHAERSYDRHFHDLAAKPGNSGYKILWKLHYSSAEPEFAKARDAVTLDLVDWSKTDAAEVERAIQQPDCLLLLFVNTSPLLGLRMHSIVVGHDGAGLYYFDTNPGALVPFGRRGSNLADLGAPPGDAYLVRKKH